MRRYCLPSGRYCQGTCGISECLKFSAGRLPGLMSEIHFSKRLLRLLFRLACTFTEPCEPPPVPLLEPPPSPPPKLPQFSDTEGRSLSMSGGATTCSQTRLRSSVIDFSRSG